MSTKQTAAEILDKAAGHMRDRASTYDKPEGERSMEQTVDIFNRFHGTALTEAQGWHFLQILKDVRLFTRTEYHQDSAEDCVAYAALKAEAMSGQDVGPADDGWIEWVGGDCPEHDRARVEIETRDGNRTSGTAIYFGWRHLGVETDIVRYRVLS